MKKAFWLTLLLCSFVSANAQSTLGRAGSAGTLTLGRAGQAGTLTYGRQSGGGPPPPPPSSRENQYLPSQVDGPCVYTGGATDGPATLPVNCMATYMSATPAPGAIVSVNTLADMNAAITNLACGQIVEINNTSVLTQSGGFVFPSLGCDSAHWIWITTLGRHNSSFPAEHTRMTPCWTGKSSEPNYPQYNCPSPATLLPTLQSTNQQATISFAAGANHYRIFGLYLPQFNIGTRNANGLINLTGTSHMVVERNVLQGAPFGCTIAGNTWSCPATDTTAGIVGGGAGYIAAMWNWVFDIGSNGSFSDAVGIALGGNGCSAGVEDVKFLVGNMVAAAGEDYLAGGGGCGTGTVTPNDALILSNHFFKNPNWALCVGGNGNGCTGAHPEWKNNGELKNWNRALIEGNVFENSWQGWQTDQAGFLSLLTPKNQSFFVTVNATSDATGSILSGTFPSNVVSPQCANGGHCMITFGSSGTTQTFAQTWSASSITVSPALTAINTTGNAKTCEPGLNPNAKDTSITYRFNEFRNGHNGIQNGAGVSDCNDVSSGSSFNMFHDNLFHGMNALLANGFSNGSGEQCFDNVNGQASPNNLHDFSQIHNTCITAPGYPHDISGLDFDLDSTLTCGGSGGTYMANVTIKDNIGTAGGLVACGQGGLISGGQAAGMAQIGCNPPGSGTCTYAYNNNVLGIGLWPQQTVNSPFVSTNQTCGSATCFPSGTAYTNAFTNYNGPNGQIGYAGNYVIPTGNVYHLSGDDSLDPGVKDWPTFNADTLNVRSGPAYPPAVINTLTLPNVLVNASYLQTLSGTGASGPNGFLWWSVIGGTPPPGITLQQPGGNCGATSPFWCIQGTAGATTGTYAFTVQLMDAVQQYAIQNLSITVTSGSPSPNPNWVQQNVPPGWTYISDFTVNQNTGEWYVADRQNGIAYSSDKGNTWTIVNTGLPSTTGVDGCTGNTLTYTCGWKVAWNPHTNDIIANVATNNTSHYYITHNKGVLWTQIPEPSGFSISRGAFAGPLMPPAAGGRMLLGGAGSTGGTTMYSTNDGVSTTINVFNPAVSNDESNGYNGNSVWAQGGENGGFHTSTDGVNFITAWDCLANVGPACGNSNDSGEIYSEISDGSGNWLMSTRTGVFLSSGPPANPTGFTHLYTSDQRSRSIGRDSFGSLYFGQKQDTTLTNPTVVRSIDKGASWQDWSGAIGHGLEGWHFVEDLTTGNICAVVQNGSVNTGNLWCSPK